MKSLFFPAGVCSSAALFFFLLWFLLFPGFSVFTQEAAPLAQGEGAVESTIGEAELVEEPPDASYIEMDIKTSTLVELAAWCRELGLNDGGSRDDLASRLRSHYKISPRKSAASPGQRIITIESAKTTEYFTLNVIDEEYARLKGDVIISLKDGNAIHRIQAWEILYNRTRNVMTASKNVVYTKEDGNTVETFKGDSITVNLDNWSSIFMDGTSEKSVSGKSTAYRFAGTVISRNDEEVTLLTRAVITNPANDEAYWSLHASKLWLLPGNDWAILNAVLEVGNIPLLYVPFFFYPADEIVFHPVLGYRSREGTFLQTTTYILGQPRSSGASENSITRIFGGDADDSFKERAGVFLRTTGEKRYDPRNIRLSLLFDAYTNLGAYLGTELSMPEKGLFGETSVSAGLGLTRNVYTAGSNYTPFPNRNGESDWNSSMLFSFGIPLRYRLNAKGSFKIEHGSLSWELPHYSDPYVDRDFMRRSEALDWLGMLREGVSTETEINDTYLNSYEWKLKGALNPTVTRFNPYISSFSISSMESSLLFNDRVSRSYNGPSAPPNPGRSFFFPSRFTMFSVSASMAGTPFSTGKSSGNTNDKTDEASRDNLLPDLPISPWASDESDDENNKVFQDTFNLSPPALNQNFTLPGYGDAQFSVDYRLTPTTASELQFRSTEANWSKPEDINWGEVASILSRFRSDGNIGLNVNHSGGGAYSGSLRFSATGSWQDYIYLNEGAEEFRNSSKTARDRAYNETYLTSFWDLSTTVKPFYQNEIWGGTNFQYSLRSVLAKTTVDTTGDNPAWDWVFGKWEKEDIDNHQISSNFIAKVKDNSQNFSISAVLPPKDTSVSGNATFRAWISETRLSGKVLFPFDGEQRLIEPVYLTETLKINSSSSFQQYIVYDPELGEYTTFTSSFNYSGFTASYSAIFAEPFRYNHNGSVDNNQPNGWLQMANKGLYPHELKFAFRDTFTRNNLWNNRLSFSLTLNSDLGFDLQRYTNSKLTFGLTLKMGITSFLDLNLSTSSENVVVFKYFQDLPFFSLPTHLYPGQETNVFVDLFNSFRFDDDNLRRSSGFKLKTLALSFTHHLGDWDAKLSMNMTPYLPPGSTSYKFNNEISFLVQWIPISEIKTQIDYSKEKLTVK
jgi:lipopolysaccharide assembly outer membrane protein LptD (OstA)